MSEITFYRQERRDGGKRTGIEVGQRTEFVSFEPGDADNDPALVWYVDVRCSGDRLPTDGDAARAWFLQHEAAIRALLERAAAEVPAGYDPVEWPLQVTDQVDGATVTVAASAVRRLEARQLS